MDVVWIARLALPLLLVAFVAVLMVWPVLRLRRETGVWAITLHREAEPGQRQVALAFLAIQLAAVALVAVYAARGPDALRVWPVAPAVTWLGLLLAFGGLVIVALAQREMGASFRIGIDEEKTRLVEQGLFGVVRNPIFSGLGVLLAGVVLAIPSVWTGLLWLAAAITIGRQTRLEERHLLALHGDEYRAYAARVGRFIPGVGRLEQPVEPVREERAQGSDSTQQ